MQNQTQSPNKDFDSKKVTKKVIFSKINVALFIFGILNVILMALFYFALKNKLQDKKILGSGKIWNIVHKCSSEHPESCDKNCNANSDCYPSCTRDCGCLKSGEVCDDDENTTQCEVAPFSCECKNNTCEIVDHEEENNDKTIDTSGWQTYQNEEYGFEVQYPNIWHQKGNGNDIKFSSSSQFLNYSDKDALITINITPDFEEDLQVWFNKFAEQCKDGCAPSPPAFDSYITIDGEPAIKALEYTPGTAGWIHIFYIKSNIKYDFFLMLPDTEDESLINNYKDIFDEMLSTFKFTD